MRATSGVMNTSGDHEGWTQRRATSNEQVKGSTPQDGYTCGKGVRPFTYLYLLTILLFNSEAEHVKHRNEYPLFHPVRQDQFDLRLDLQLSEFKFAPRPKPRWFIEVTG